MDQFRHIGEVLGSLTARMVLQEDIQINRRQCLLLLDMFSLAFNTIAEEIKLNLKLEEKSTKWKALEQPLRELHRVFKEGDLYVKRCMDKRDWWGKAINLHQNKDCVEFHIHNLLCCFPAVIEAIETAGEISGLDQDEMQKRRLALARKYDMGWNEPKLFQWRFGKQYLIPREFCRRFDSACKEDIWNIAEALKEKKSSVSASKNEQHLADLLFKKIIGSDCKLSPSSILYEGDFQVRRRLGAQYKEIQWLGDNFVLRQIHWVAEPISAEISSLLSLSHPHILQYLCGFYDDEKKEVSLVMELMSKDLSCYMKENCGARRRILFPLPVVVDIMYQIARGMEYLHSKKIYHGDLNPSNVFLRTRKYIDGYFHVKISGFGSSDIKSVVFQNSAQNQVEANPSIWYAPEVLLEQEHDGSAPNTKYTEKADVYSFAMLCFELLTGKVPFDDSHLQGEKTSRNLRAGERPLFPYTAPRYLVNLTKRCWHTDPAQRPSFSSICRVLRYVKKFLVMNQDHDELELQVPAVDYFDIESWFLKQCAGEGCAGLTSVAQVPFEMFAYRLAERDKNILATNQEKTGDLASEVGSVCKDENLSVVDDPFACASDTKSAVSDSKSVCSDIKSVCSDIRSICSEIVDRKSLLPEIRERRPLFPEIPERRRSLFPDIPEKRSLFTETREKRSPRSKIDKRTPALNKTTSDTKQKSSPGKTTPRITRSLTLNQRPHNVKTIRENRHSKVAGSLSPMVSRRRRRGPGDVSE